MYACMYVCMCVCIYIYIYIYIYSDSLRPAALMRPTLRRAKSRGADKKVARIPFGDHPLKLGRYRED